MSELLRNIDVKFRVCVEPDDDGFHAYCPAFKGLHVGGETVEEAIDNAREAAELYLRSLVRHRDPLPVGDDFIIHREPARTHGDADDQATPVSGPISREITTSVPRVV